MPSLSNLLRCLAAAFTLLALTGVNAQAQDQAQQQVNPKVRVETSLGNIVIELDAVKAPVSVANFLNYVEAGHYENTLFHRVIPNFMIQGGGFDTHGQQKNTQKPIINEAKNGLKNARGTIAMARTSAPNSATSQFFINTVNNTGLDYPSSDGHGYAVFGKVIEGMDVVDAISATPTGTGTLSGYPARDVPRMPIMIQRVVLIESVSAEQTADAELDPQS